MTYEQVSQIADDALARSLASDDALASDVRALSSSVSALAESNESEGVTQSVTLDSEQWTLISDYVTYSSEVFRVQNFLLLALLFVACALLGTRLWSDLARGWRR